MFNHFNFDVNVDYFKILVMNEIYSSKDFKLDFVLVIYVDFDVIFIINNDRAKVFQNVIEKNNVVLGLNLVKEKKNFFINSIHNINVINSTNNFID